MSSRLLVLGWHNVEGSWCFPSPPGVGSRGMARQLRFLRRAANVVPLAEALGALAVGRPLPPRAVAITFDDGYRDNLELAVPLLERLRLPATFFLVPGILSGLVRPWWEVLGWAFSASGRRDAITWEDQDLPLARPTLRRSSYERVAEQLKRRNRRARDEAVECLVELLSLTGRTPDKELFFGWDEARTLVRRGFAVGSHTLYHAILSEEEAGEQERDLTASRRQLEDGLEVPVDLLAYPNGTERDYDATTVAAARRAGYAFALTTRAGWNRPTTPPYEVRRLVVYPEWGAAGLGARIARIAADVAVAGRTPTLG